MYLIFTDLDGTLLNHDTYSWEAAVPALNELRRQQVPWVLVTSKTRAEVEHWRHLLENDHPFIVENGAAAFLPAGYFSASLPEAKRVENYDVLEWGTPYAELVADLRAASQSSACPVRGFHEMTAGEVSRLCQMPLDQALLAKQREYDEPFVILDRDRSGALAAAIEAKGRRWTRGGRFWHITGPSDKASAVQALSRLYEHMQGEVRTIGLGDGLNDASFLNVVTTPVLIRSCQTEELRTLVPRGTVADPPGPAGWNAAVLKLIR